MVIDAVYCICAKRIHWISSREMSPLQTSPPSNLSTTTALGDQNTTNGTKCSPGNHGEWVFTVFPVYTLLITAFGVVFNIFVLVVFCFNKRACTVPEIYLSNLAAADLFLVSFLPFWAVNVFKRYNWPFSNPLCKLVTLSIRLNANCSIYFLVLISIDRYIALVHPLSDTRIRKSKFAKLACLLVWCFGLIMSIPMLIYRRVKHHPNINTTMCFADFPDPVLLHLYEDVMILFNFIIPISIISYSTFKIKQVLNKRINGKETEQKASILLSAVLLAFLICWVPFYIVSIVELLNRAGVFRHCGLETVIDTCRQLFVYLAFSNSVFNPVLYVIVGKNFRGKAKEMFFHSSDGDPSNTATNSFGRKSF